MHPFDKGLFRTAARLNASRHALDELWRELTDHAAAGNAALREAAALVATARWSVATAIHRAESRGMHRREDHPDQDRDLAVRLLARGFDRIQVAIDGPATAAGLGRTVETAS